MTLRLRFTARAVCDLANIKHYISSFDPKAAERVRLRIDHSISILLEFPGTGRPTTKHGVLLSVVPRYGYKIYFTVVEEELQVIHIRHGSRDEPEPHELAPDG